MDITRSYTDEIVARRAAQAVAPRVSLRAECKKLFGFGDSEIPLNEHMRLFQRYQNEMGISNNQRAIFDRWIQNKIIRQISQPIVRGSLVYYITNFRIGKPTLPGSVEQTMTPQEAVARGETYAATGYAQFTAMALDGGQGLAAGFVEQEIGRFPIMKGSALCWLNNIPDDYKSQVGECFNDPQGYFIIKGNEKAVISQEKMAKSQIHITNFKADEGLEARMTCLSLTESTVVKLNFVTKARAGIRIHLTYMELDKSVNIFVMFAMLYYMMYVDEHGEYLMRDYGCLETVKQIIETVVLPAIYNHAPSHEQSRIRHQLNLTIARAFGDIKAHRTMGELFEEFRSINHLQPKIGNRRQAMSSVADPLQDVRSFLFGHIPAAADRSDLPERLELLARMTCMLVRVRAGLRPHDDRDAWANKRIETAGIEMERGFNALWAKAIANWPTVTALSGSTGLFQSKEITDGLVKMFNQGGGWGNGAKARSVGDLLKRETPLAIYSQIQRVTSRAPTKASTIAIRQIHPSQVGFICTGETSEGANVGLLKNLASTTWISLERDTTTIRGLIMQRMEGQISATKTETHSAPLMADGRIMFWCNPDVALASLRILKSDPETFDISISYSELDNCVEVYSDGARPCRPLFVVDELTRRLVWDNLTAEQKELPIMELVKLGAIEFVHAKEQETSWTMTDVPENILPRKRTDNRAYIKIAEYPNDVALFAEQQAEARAFLQQYENMEVPAEIRNEYNRQYRIASLQMFSHAEIEPQSQLGISGCTIPAANHNQGPRITYQCSMGKQAHSGYHSLWHLRKDTSFKRLLGPTRALFETDIFEPIGLNAMPSTETPIVAIMARSVNNEDALVVKEEFLTQNLLYVKHSTHREPLMPNTEIRADLSAISRNPEIYHAIIPEGKYAGLPRVGAYLKENDCLFMRFVPSDRKDSTMVPRHVMMGVGEDGYVESVNVIAATKNRKETVVIRIASIRRQVPGDKLAIPISQKGTIGEVRPARLLPRVKGGPNDGLVPDFYFNPHSIPSRMTQTVMKYGICAKAALYSGKRPNATSFYVTDAQINEAEAVLRSVGLAPDGTEAMVRADGTPLESRIFVAPIGYQALRHNVADKIQMRNRGTYMPLTHQPMRGRANRGGIKTGEMERDSIISHGGSDSIIDRFMTSSDKCNTIWCATCGTLAISDFTREGTRCSECVEGKAKFVFVVLPYIFLLVIRMLAIFNITTRLKLKPIQN